MASNPKKSRARFKRRRLKRNSKKISNLLLAAATIPTLSMSATLQADSPPKQTSVRFQYYDYRDRQDYSENRMTIKAPMAWFRTPVGEHTAVEGSFVLDSVSGASPYYHNTLSGASGTGIQDERTAGNLRATRYFENFSIGLGSSYSSEDDYESLGVSVETRIWTPDNNTIFSFGASTSSDDISSTNNPDLDESMKNYGAILGITQIIDKYNIVQSNITLTTKDGYLSDPYKIADQRPRSRDELAWLSRWVSYFPEYEASLHTDYRYFRDSWGIISHMVETSWYQPFAESWMVVPRFRFYSQSKADFFSSLFPPEDDQSFYSADNRLSGFGSASLGFQFIRKLSEAVSAYASFDYMQQRARFKIGSPGSANVEDLDARIIGVGMQVKF